MYKKKGHVSLMGKFLIITLYERDYGQNEGVVQFHILTVISNIATANVCFSNYVLICVYCTLAVFTCLWILSYLRSDCKLIIFDNVPVKTMTDELVMYRASYLMCCTHPRRSYVQNYSWNFLKQLSLQKFSFNLHNIKLIITYHIKK